MMLYQKMYLHLFNAVTDAIEDMERGNVSGAKLRLIKAQQETEDLFCAETENISGDGEIILDNSQEKC